MMVCHLSRPPSTAFFMKSSLRRIELFEFWPAMVLYASPLKSLEKPAAMSARLLLLADLPVDEVEDPWVIPCRHPSSRRAAWCRLTSPVPRRVEDLEGSS
jgi:hypothetical protein